MKKKEIKDYMNSVRKYLITRYGEVKGEWEFSLLCLENSLVRYNQINESINNNGIYDVSTGRKNPLLSTEKDVLATIFKLTQKLGITPYDSSKIKQAEEDDSNLLSAIMGEDEDE